MRRLGAAFLVLVGMVAGVAFVYSCGGGSSVGAAGDYPEQVLAYLDAATVQDDDNTNLSLWEGSLRFPIPQGISEIRVEFPMWASLSSGIPPAYAFTVNWVVTASRGGCPLGGGDSVTSEVQPRHITIGWEECNFVSLRVSVPPGVGVCSLGIQGTMPWDVYTGSYRVDVGGAHVIPLAVMGH